MLERNPSIVVDSQLINQQSLQNNSGVPVLQTVLQTVIQQPLPSTSNVSKNLLEQNNSGVPDIQITNSGTENHQSLLGRSLLNRYSTDFELPDDSSISNEESISQ